MHNLLFHEVIRHVGVSISVYRSISSTSRKGLYLLFPPPSYPPMYNESHFIHFHFCSQILGEEDSGVGSFILSLCTGYQENQDS